MSIRDVNWKLATPTDDELMNHLCCHGKRGDDGLFQDYTFYDGTRRFCTECGAELTPIDEAKLEKNIEELIPMIESIKLILPRSRYKEPIATGLSTTISFLRKIPTINMLSLAVMSEEFFEEQKEKINNEQKEKKEP